MATKDQFEAKHILDYWFGPIENGTTLENRSRLWFGGDQSTDDYIRKHFESQLAQAEQGKLDHWQQTPQGTLALIILLDQFPLNMYRKSARAFEFEAQGVSVCLSGLAKKQHHQLSYIEKTFFYLPLEHSENIDHQQMCVDLFTELLDNAPAHLREHAKNSLDYAVKHHAIVERFNRFPHRNEFLERDSTLEEIDFLQDRSNRFGQ